MFHSTYSARDVIINYCGVNLEGKADGEFLNVAYNSERTEIRSGADGNKSIALNADHSIEITLTLFPESTSAKILNGIFAALREVEQYGSDNGSLVSGNFPMVITDSSGTLLLAARSAILTSVGAISLGTNTGTQEFKFYAADPILAPLPASLAEDINNAVSRFGVTVPVGI